MRTLSKPSLHRWECGWLWGSAQVSSRLVYLIVRLLIYYLLGVSTGDITFFALFGVAYLECALTDSLNINKLLASWEVVVMGGRQLLIFCCCGGWRTGGYLFPVRDESYPYALQLLPARLVQPPIIHSSKLIFHSIATLEGTGNKLEFCGLTQPEF